MKYISCFKQLGECRLCSLETTTLLRVPLFIVIYRENESGSNYHLTRFIIEIKFETDHVSENGNDIVRNLHRIRHVIC